MLIAAIGCGEGASGTPARDAWVEDPAVALDAGAPGADAGAAVDAADPDASFADVNEGDGAVRDALAGDAGSGDAGSGDAGSGDAGSGDAGSGDAGSGDAGSGDAAGSADAAPLPLVPFVAGAELAHAFEPGLVVGDVVLRFAPIFYHDTGSGGPDALGARQDYLMAVDYDGDRRHDNNWDHLADWDLRAHIYYGFVATPSHYFISFAEYHARDWAQRCTGLFTECHEGDMETVRVIVARGTTAADDRVVLLLTGAHGRGYAWGEDPSLDGAFDCEDDAGSIGECDGARTHARVYIQEEGHGPIACRAGEDPPALGYFGFGGGVRCAGAVYESGFIDGTGIVFRPTLGEGTIFSAQVSVAEYSLTAVWDTLFAWRYEVGSGMLWRSSSAFVYAGSRGAPFSFALEIGGRYDPMQFVNDASSGSAPWNDDRHGNNGDSFFDPAFVFASRFVFLSPVAVDYTYNPYVFGQ